MRLPSNPIVYLVGSNLVFWGLPFVLIHFGSHPDYISRPSALTASVPSSTLSPSSISISSRNPSPSAEISSEQPNMLARAHGPSHKSVAGRPIPVSAASEISQAPQQSRSASAAIDAMTAESASPNLLKQLDGADGLGGAITLNTKKEPIMPVAAMAEKLHQQRAGDPLSAVPLHWRDSLRKELKGGQTVNNALVVRVPVPTLEERQEVPVIVNDKGVANGLVAPRDERVRSAVEKWASRQAASNPGTVQVYVVAAEPLSADTP
jgi:hypothetical protein